MKRECVFVSVYSTSAKKIWSFSTAGAVGGAHNILGFNPGTLIALAGSYVQAQVPQEPPQIITIMDGWPIAKA